MAFFSIVMPLFNKEQFISNTIQSVLNQTFDDFELIVVNDGSTDNSLKIINEIKDSKILIYSTENSGTSAARNFGIRKSNANHICLLDADDLWKPHHLENLKQLIDSHPGCGMYCTSYEKIFFNKTIIKNIHLGLDDTFKGILPDYFYHSLINQIASSSSVAIPKIIFKTIGFFDLGLRSGQDTDMWIRIASKYKTAFTSNVSVTVIFSGEENHLSSSKMKVDRVKLLGKFKELEKSNSNFKKYMDLNRFSVALERKTKNDKIWKSIIKDIDFENLNFKQKTLIRSPKQIIILMKRFQNYLLRNNIYLSAFK